MAGIKTYIILFGGVFALSTSAIFVKTADAPSAVIAFYRLLTAGLILAPFLIFSPSHREEVRNLDRGRWTRIALAGLLLALHYCMWFESLNLTSVASSTVLVSLQPLFSIAYERIWGGNRVTPMALAGCLVALVGSFIIGSGDFSISGMALVGDIVAFLAAGVIALYFFVGGEVRKNTSAVTYSVLSYAVSTVCLCAYMLIRGNAFLGYSTATWLSFAGIAIISTIGGQFVFNLLLKDIPSSAVTMSILGEPIGTCILAYFLLNEVIMPRQFLGIAVIMIGMTMFYARPAGKS